MMMTAEIQPTDPAALLAIKDQLELSDEQAAKLTEIISHAREQAQAVLLESQLAKAKELGDKSMSMMQMCGKMGMCTKTDTSACPMSKSKQACDSNKPKGTCPKSN